MCLYILVTTWSEVEVSAHHNISYPHLYQEIASPFLLTESQVSRLDNIAMNTRLDNNGTLNKETLQEAQEPNILS